MGILGESKGVKGLPLTILSEPTSTTDTMETVDTCSNDDSTCEESSKCGTDSPDSSHRVPSEDWGSIQDVEIELDPEVSAMLCRRGRQRLRDLQRKCPEAAVIRVDRIRGILYCSGPESATNAIRSYVTNLSAPVREVSPALWYELMRTRMQSNYLRTDVTAARLQEETSCRIHIERNRYEVRLFSDQDIPNVPRADELLHEMASQCTEVNMKNAAASLTSTHLEAVSKAAGVTLRIDDDDSVTVFGLHLAVAEAVAEMGRLLAHARTGQVDKEPAEPAAPQLEEDQLRGPGVVVTAKQSPASVDQQSSLKDETTAATCGHSTADTCKCRQAGVVAGGRFCTKCGRLLRKAGASDLRSRQPPQQKSRASRHPPQKAKGSFAPISSQSTQNVQCAQWDQQQQSVACPVQMPINGYVMIGCVMGTPSNIVQGCLMPSAYYCTIQENAQLPCGSPAVMQ
eukprot:gnl/TRDRNA2_/TRDRNA2_93683_c0_seq1.p1 gnl/TRDRNA2_/TRDRNA2_93683_c0~~gnl/TRDRNA2_/TRDRNA2_93683_c0_seq1.p1  ORF type:complete len:456 (+),score=71.72 gnl/TRDRNA2_/TRDRNA2_93683_c0_seq1:86-1453(+)